MFAGLALLFLATNRGFADWVVKRRTKVPSVGEVEYSVEDTGDTVYVEAHFVDDEGRRRAAGGMAAYRDPSGEWSIGSAEVKRRFRQLRIGTSLYEVLGSHLCKRKQVESLRSDKTRTPYAESFWRKQVRLGRARCVPGAGYAIGWRETHDERLPKPDRIGDEAWWPCRQYEIPCPLPSLEGEL